MILVILLVIICIEYLECWYCKNVSVVYKNCKRKNLNVCGLSVFIVGCVD